MDLFYKANRAARITRRIAAVLASALITFTLFHEVATLGEPGHDATASAQLVRATTHLASAGALAAIH